MAASLALLLVAVMAFAHAPTHAAAVEDFTQDPIDDNAQVETKKLLDGLNISMVAEVLDERTFRINWKDHLQAGLTKLRLGNVAPPEQGDLGQEEYQKKLEVAKDALAKVLEKQMIWWKAANDTHQPQNDDNATDPIVLADVWLIDGRHVNGLLRSTGHLSHAEEYHEEFARNILTAEADEAKKQAYKELEEALRESSEAHAKEIQEAKQKAQEAREKAAKEARERKEKEAEAVGVGGWIAVVLLGALVCGTVLVKILGNQSTKKRH